MTDLLRQSPTAFKDFLVGEGIRRFFLVWDAEREEVRASHPQLDALARLLGEDRRDFDRHEGFFVQVAPETGVLQGACIHRTCRGQAAGGVRFWRYDTVEEYLRDGLRLARGMTHKNALAGLWWGGGKGVMARGTGQNEDDATVRRRVYEEYGAFMTSLRPPSSRRRASRPASHPSSGGVATPRSRPPAASSGAWRPHSTSSRWVP
jgi:leucine dehydrogenase